MITDLGAEAGTSGRVQIEHDPTELGHEREEGGEGNQVHSQEAQRYKEREKVKWLDYIEKSSPVTWAGKFRIWSRICQPREPL